MKVLIITGDKNFKPGNERYDLQKSAVEVLEVVYWGRGSLWPKIPSGKFDVVTTQDAFWRGLFGMRVAKRLGAKLNVQVHTDLSAYRGIKHILPKIVLRHADTIRVVSEKIKQQVEEIGVKAKITVLPVFVDISKFKNVVRKEHTGKNILWVGRYEGEKDPLTAIAVFEKVLQSVPDAKLIMIGQGGLQNLLKARAQSKPIEIHGWEDPAAYLAVADVVLCTSLHESWGASIVEALAAGVPVVAPDVGIAKEVGAIVADRKDLAKELVKVLQSGVRANLQLSFLTKEEWAAKWKETLQ
ncbi:MAG TPA: glycosyltransferase family 4 protein [Candidatus Paceibacterota bacterium]|nr:glycosyltransferase family 4 protein [Candidatus Paceibacterota bacterium]